LFWIFIVLKNDAANPPNNAAGLWKWTVGLSSHHPWDGDGQIYDDFGTSVRKTAGTPIVALNTWHVYNVYSAANDYGVYINGSLQFTTVTNTVQFWAQDAIVGMSWYEPQYPGNQDPYDGDIAAILFYDRKLTATERTNITTYLKSVYGIV